MPKPFLYIENLSKQYARKKQEPLVVFEDVTFGVEKGEFVCLIGHSGCGKSTILSILTGLARATAGYVFVDGRPITEPSLSRGVIFQNHSLLPWKTARQNVMFSVRARWPKWSRSEIRDHSEKYLAMVGLTEALDRKPSELSGGMRQRVGIARAFATKPDVLLMDEPFGALDALTRGVIQDELLKIWNEAKQTVVMITHDVDEAIYLSDRILLMSEGPRAQIAQDVPVPIPRPRDRGNLFKTAGYYDIRNRLLDFLVNGSKAEALQADAAPKPETMPSGSEAGESSDGSLANASSAQVAALNRS